MHTKCFWCHKDEVSLNLDNLCSKCLKWFNLQTKNSKIKASKIPKRITILNTKYNVIKEYLTQFENADAASKACLSFFKPTQYKLLDVLKGRYFDRKTLEEIASQWGVTREYVRQCENKLIEILFHKTKSSLDISSMLEESLTKHAGAWKELSKM